MTLVQIPEVKSQLLRINFFYLGERWNVHNATVWLKAELSEALIAYINHQRMEIQLEIRSATDDINSRTLARLLCFLLLIPTTGAAPSIICRLGISYVKRTR